MGRERQHLEQIRLWRQLAAWAPVVWFPVLIFGFLTGRRVLGITHGLAGPLFAGAARAVVWFTHCPRCGVHFGSSTGVFRQVWDLAGCLDCGLSLFVLRRGKIGG